MSAGGVTFEGVATRQTDLEVTLKESENVLTLSPDSEADELSIAPLGEDVAQHIDLGCLPHTGWQPSYEFAEPPGLALNVTGIEMDVANAVYQAAIVGNAAGLAQLLGMPVPEGEEGDGGEANGGGGERGGGGAKANLEAAPASALPTGPWSIVDVYGVEPLAHAATSGSLTAVRVLLDASANVDAVCKDGQSAMHRAARRGHVEVVEALLAKGASIDVQTNEGLTPLHLAAGDGQLAVANALLSAGASHALVDGTGMTPLMHAAESGDASMAAALVEAGASTLAEDRNGWSALHHAATSGDQATASLLAEHGAPIDKW